MLPKFGKGCVGSKEEGRGRWLKGWVLRGSSGKRRFWVG